MNDQKDLALLDNYLMGNLSVEESASLERRLQTDPKLAQQYQALIDLKEGFRYIDLKNTLTNIKDWELVSTMDESFEQEVSNSIAWTKHKAKLEEIKGFEDGPVKKLQKRKSNLTWWKIAAGIALILSVSLYLFAPFTNDSELIVERYFKPSKAIGILRSPVTQEEQLQAKALELYNAKKYKDAIPLFETLKKQYQISDYDFYLGSAYLGDGQAEKAIDLLERYEEFPSFLQQEARWHLALGCIGDGQDDQAKQILETLSLEQNLPNFIQPNAIKKNLDEKK